MQIQQFLQNFLNNYIFGNLLTEMQSTLILAMMTFTFFWLLFSAILSIFERKRVRL